MNIYYRADYSGLVYSCRAEFDDTPNKSKYCSHKELKHKDLEGQREDRYWVIRANPVLCVNL